MAEQPSLPSEEQNQLTTTTNGTTRRWHDGNTMEDDEDVMIDEDEGKRNKMKNCMSKCQTW